MALIIVNLQVFLFFQIVALDYLAVEGSSITVDCSNGSDSAILEQPTTFSFTPESTSTSSLSNYTTNLARSNQNIPVPSIEQISLILWYKSDQSSRIPFYSVDARHVPVQSARHQSNHSRARTLLGPRTSGTRPQLRIWDLQANDTGEYRCRLDFRNQRTLNALFRLKVLSTYLNIKFYEQ